MASTCRTSPSCRSMRCMTPAFSPTLVLRPSAMSRSSMPKPSDDQQQALTQLLGFGSHSARKSHSPELLSRLEELEAERNRYKWLFEHAVHGIFQASLQEGIRAANPALARMLGYDSPEDALWALTDLSHHLFIGGDRKSTRLNSSHVKISYAV